MASSDTKTPFAVVLLLLLVWVLPTTTIIAAAEEVRIGGPEVSEINNVKIASITAKLFKMGYGAMAVHLPKILYPYLTQPPTYCNPTELGRFTIFAPTDFAFSYPMYAYHNLTTLLQFHVVPFLHLNKHDLWKFKPGDTVDTLLPNIPLVSSRTGFNHIPVKQYGIYDDGRVIIHGVYKFYNPNEQIYSRRLDWTGTAGYGGCTRTSDAAPIIP